MISSISGFFLCKSDADFSEFVSYIYGVTSSFRPAFVFELIFLLALFMAGPTIYAPALSVASIIIYALMSGAEIACGTDGGAFISLLQALLAALCTYLFIVYSSFVTLTGLRLFSSTPKSSQKELFDGVMFRTESFKGFFNYKFLASYIAFFVVFSLAIEVLCVLKVLLKG